MICSAEGKILTQILKFPSKFTQVQWISSQKIPKLQKNERGINDLILEQNKKRIFLWMEKVRPIVKAEGYLKVKWEKSLLFVPLDLDSDSRISSVSPSGFTVEKRNGEIMDKKVEKSVEELAKNICWAHKLVKNIFIFPRKRNLALFSPAIFDLFLLLVIYILGFSY